MRKTNFYSIANYKWYENRWNVFLALTGVRPYDVQTFLESSDAFIDVYKIPFRKLQKMSSYPGAADEKPWSQFSSPPSVPTQICHQASHVRHLSGIHKSFQQGHPLLALLASILHHRGKATHCCSARGAGKPEPPRYRTIWAPPLFSIHSTRLERQ